MAIACLRLLCSPCLKWRISVATSCCALGPYLRRPELDPPPLDPPDERDDREDFAPDLPPRDDVLERAREELDFFAADFLAEVFFAADFFAADFLAADFLAGALFAAVFRDATPLAERPPADLREELEVRLLDDFLLAVFRPELLLGIKQFSLDDVACTNPDKS